MTQVIGTADRKIHVVDLNNPGSIYRVRPSLTVEVLARTDGPRQSTRLSNGKRDQLHVSHRVKLMLSEV